MSLESKPIPNPFEKLKIKEQWDKQIKILSKLEIIQIIESKKLGILGIDGKEYAVPTYIDIQKRLEANKEMITRKMEQGFTKLLIEPFGYSFNELEKKYEKIILEHHNNGKLFATKENDTDPDEKLDLDINKPVYVWEDGYKNCDTEDKIVYFPKEFNKKNHGGKTKKELLAEESSNGWRIWLLEDVPNIPREGKGKEVGKRRQIEAGKKPTEYLQMLQNEEIYKNESGLTPEADIMNSIIQLEEKNQVSNDWQGKGSLSYQIGAYFPASALVPASYWYRDYRRAYLDRFVVSARDEDYGLRVGVRV